MGGVGVRYVEGRGTCTRENSPAILYLNLNILNNHSHGGGFNSEKGQATTPTNLWFYHDISVQTSPMSINKAQQWQTIEVAGLHIFKRDFYFACPRVRSQTPYNIYTERIPHSFPNNAHIIHTSLIINTTYFISPNHTLLPMFTCYPIPDHDQLT